MIQSGYFRIEFASDGDLLLHDDLELPGAEIVYCEWEELSAEGAPYGRICFEDGTVVKADSLAIGILVALANAATKRTFNEIANTAISIPKDELAV